MGVFDGTYNTKVRRDDIIYRSYIYGWIVMIKEIELAGMIIVLVSLILGILTLGKTDPVKYFKINKAWGVKNFFASNLMLYYYKKWS